MDLIPVSCHSFSEGEWLANAFHGWGVRQWADGEVYEGAWRDGKRHGQGLMRWGNGDVYEGAWEDDKRCGEGEIRYAGGSSYRVRTLKSFYKLSSAYLFSTLSLFFSFFFFSFAPQVIFYAEILLSL